ncbi:MAG: Rieske (2Fe-2S) protein [Myxococcales bacterium]|nr:Rieske (2Fe-2S) protein [Myxococcales bacterium]
MSPSSPKRKDTENWVWVAESGSLVEGVPISRTVAGQSVLIVRYGGQFWGVEDRCPHRDVPLHKGQVVDGCIECPLHGWRFDLPCGRGITVPGTSIRSFPVKEIEGRLYLGV